MSNQDDRTPPPTDISEAPPTADQEKRGQPLVRDCLPEIPEEFHELQLIKVVHPSLFYDQAALLKARFDAFMKAGFTEEQAMKIILRWGLKKNLTDS